MSPFAGSLRGKLAILLFQSMKRARPSAFCTSVMLTAGMVGSVSAQVQPDAGRIQQELESSRIPGTVPRPSAAPVLEQPARPALSAPDGARFMVEGFRITHATVFVEAELQALLKDFAGKELSLADLHRAADAITIGYRERGFFVARAYVPTQEIRDGMVEIMVLEGKLDSISLKLSPELRLHGSVVEETLRAALPAGGVIHEDELERGLLLLNDIPGVDVRAVLSPGTVFGTSIITAEVGEGPLISGNVDFDNQGSKFTGSYRAGVTFNLNDPTGHGDFFTARAMMSAGSKFGRVAYQMPVGPHGLKLGGAYAESSYELCCEFAPLRASGTARTTTLSALYPFLRSRKANLHGAAALSTRHYFNATIAGITSDKQADVVTLGINGENHDFLGDGGLNSFALASSFGQLNLDGWSVDRVADAASASTHGNYRKIAYSMARQQRFGETISLHARLSGQLASKNLDSSEKFALGGPLGLRAYSSGEAVGDEGLLLNLELRHDIQSALQFVAFVGYGEIRLHKNEWPGWQGANTRIGNRYGLSDIGLALNWHQPGDFLIHGSVAQTIGENPGRDINGNDAENTRRRMRLWLQMVSFF